MTFLTCISHEKRKHSHDSVFFSLLAWWFNMLIILKPVLINMNFIAVPRHACFEFMATCLVGLVIQS